MSLAQRLRTALASPCAEPLLAGDLPGERDGPTVEAAVLMAVTERPQPGIILTVRREHLRTHAGQIALPGGRVDKGEDAVAAALREAREEVAIETTEVDVVARLDAYRTVTGYVVTPVLGVVAPDLPLTPHDLEVADWFEAPLAHVLDPGNHRRESAVFRGLERDYYVIDWNGRRIWGATAAMLINLSRRLQWL